jgi:hypothetical protein
MENNNDNYVLTTNDIYESECIFLDEEKQHGKYYIGKGKYVETNSSIDSLILLLSCCISVNSFFLFSFKTIEQYLNEFSIYLWSYSSNKINKHIDFTNNNLKKSNVQIFQLIIQEDFTYSIIIKTHWIRLVQRYWRKIFNLRKKIILKRMTIHSQMYFQHNGKYPNGLNILHSYANNFNVFDKYKFHKLQLNIEQF